MCADASRKTGLWGKSSNVFLDTHVLNTSYIYA